MSAVASASVAAGAASIIPDAIASEDPIFAAIERARRIEIIFDELEEDEVPSGGGLHELHDARSALAETSATTPAGLAALTEFLRWAQGNLHGTAPYFDDADDAAALFASLDASVRGMTGLAPSTEVAGTAIAARPARDEGKPDPIFAAIEARKSTHERAEAAYRAQADRENALGAVVAQEDDLYLDLEAEADERRDDCATASTALTRTLPTTLAGCAMLAAYGAEVYSARDGGWPRLANEWEGSEGSHRFMENQWPIRLLRNLASALRDLDGGQA